MKCIYIVPCKAVFCLIVITLNGLNLGVGLEQAGVLSAVLYLVYINNLLRVIGSNKFGCVLLDIEISSSR